MQESKAAGVPQLVAKIASFDDLLLVEADVLTLRCDAHQPEAQTISTIFRDQVERVRRVAEAFRHLAPLLITDNSGEIHVAKRHFARILQPGHDHPRHPEEDDVRTSDERAGRIELSPRRFVHGLVRPEPRRKPGVEHIRILNPPIAGGLNLALHACVPFSLIILVPDRDAMAPPELARDAPVLDVLEPVIVDFFPALRKKPDRAVTHGGTALGRSADI